MGIANADGRNTQPIGMQGGIPIFERHVAFGFFIIVEAAAGQSGQNPGTLTFNWSPDDPNLLPNLRIVSSRPLGNGSPAVCDDGPEPPIGGVPATDPPVFGGTQASANAINDFACRFEGRTQQTNACTKNFGGDGEFVRGTATFVQFCPFLGIGSELAFPAGDTKVTAQVSAPNGQPGPSASIIVRFTP
jgi:hypothetical protein